MIAVWDAKAQDIPYTAELFDCLIAECLLSDGRYIPQLGAALLKHKVKSIDELAEKQKENLIKDSNLQYLFDHIEMPLVEVLSEMEKTGILIDRTCLKDVKEELQKASEKIRKTILEKVGYEINFFVCLSL